MKLLFALAAAVSLLATGCGGGSDATESPAVSDTSILVTGKAVAPDGTTPVANALVYVEKSSVSTTLEARAAEVLACGTSPATAAAATCSASDGSFSLSTTSTATGQLKLVMLKGAFTSAQVLAASSGGSINAGNVAFTTLVSAGAPKMAVVMGDFDSIEDVLAKLGFGESQGGKLKVGTEKFTLYNGRSDSATLLPASVPPVTKLFEDADGDGRADIFNYQIVFVNCGQSRAFDFDASKKAILRSYVQGGGRLYVSDQAYGVVEDTFPEFIDFLGSDTTPSAIAETAFAAYQGDEGITVNASVDPVLKAWLQSVSCTTGSCVQADGTVKIEGFLIGWAVINGPQTSSANLKTWVQGPVSYETTQNVNKPLTVSFDFGTGRVTYTSYHNEEGLGITLSPQQRILQYLVFEL